MMDSKKKAVVIMGYDWTPSRCCQTIQESVHCMQLYAGTFHRLLVTFEPPS
jgi:hypothetical protein